MDIKIRQIYNISLCYDIKIPHNWTVSVMPFWYLHADAKLKVTVKN